MFTSSLRMLAHFLPECSSATPSGAHLARTTQGSVRRALRGGERDGSGRDGAPPCGATVGHVEIHVVRVQLDNSCWIVEQDRRI